MYLVFETRLVMTVQARAGATADLASVEALTVEFKAADF